MLQYNHKQVIDIEMKIIEKITKNKRIIIAIGVSLVIISAFYPILKNIKRAERSNAVAPQIDRVFPSVGAVSGGDKIRITGRNFEQAQGVKWLEVHFYHSCVMATNNRTFCWGWNNSGELGIGGSGYIQVPFQIIQGDMPPNTHIVRMSNGGMHTCAIGSDNQTYCWGPNYYGQLGNGSTTDANRPVRVVPGQVPYGVFIKQISTSVGHTCAIASNNQTYCWGGNQYGQLGNGTNNNASIPIAIAQGAIPAGVYLKYVSAGYDHTCAIASNNQTYCWGGNQYGQLGNGTNNNASIPIAIAQGAIPAGVYLTQIQSAGMFTCGLGSNGWVYCWGQNHGGQLGNGTNHNKLVPTQILQGAIPNGVLIKQISASGNIHSCALAINNQAYCWGNGDNGKLGDGNTSGHDSLVPTQVLQGAIPVGLAINTIGTGNNHSCALASNNWVYCWGNSTHGLLGNGVAASGNDSGVPVAIFKPGVMPSANVGTRVRLGSVDLPTSAVRFISANEIEVTLPAKPASLPANTPLSITVTNPDGTVYTHNNAYTYYQPSVPTITSVAPNSGAVSGGGTATITGTNFDNLKFKQVSVSPVSTCAIDYEGKLYCWGYWLGNALPKLMPAWMHLRLRTIANANGSVCGITYDNVTYCAGRNDLGQLANGTANNSPGPVRITQGQIPSDVYLTTIDAAEYTLCGLGSDNRVYCWGHGANGLLGNGTTVNSHVPVQVSQGQIPTDVTITSVSLGWKAGCVTTTNGNAYCWSADNSSGLLGHWDNSNSLVPRMVTRGEIPHNVTITKIVPETLHTCALTSEGKAYCWGNNAHGVLGTGNNTSSLTPKAIQNGQIPAHSRIVGIVLGDSQTCVITTDNNAYCFGHNNGELGTGVADHTNLPTRVAQGQMIAGTYFTSIDSNVYHSCGISSDARVYCWGNVTLPGSLLGATNNSTLVPVRSVMNNYNVNFGSKVINDLIPVSDTSLQVTIPPANQANPTAPAPHAGVVNVNLARQSDSVTTNNLQYTYQVPITVPQAPINVSASPAVDTHQAGAIRLKFQSPSANYDDTTPSTGNGNAPITDYVIQYCRANATGDGCKDPTAPMENATIPDNWVTKAHSPMQSTPTNPADHNLSLVIDHLNPGGSRRYVFRVAARNQAGVGAYSTVVSSIPSFITMSTSSTFLDHAITPIYNQTLTSRKLTINLKTNLSSGYVLKMSSIDVENRLVQRLSPPIMINATTHTFNNPGLLGANTWGFYIPNTTTNQAQSSISYAQFTNNATPVANKNAQNVADKYAVIPPFGQAVTIAQYNQATDKKLDVIFGVNVNKEVISGTYRSAILLEMISQ